MPVQNGLAERSVEPMLLDQNVTGLRLRQLQFTLKIVTVQGKTPYEVLPRDGHFRVFGCDTYDHIPRDELGKLDTKARKCIFVGYGEETKGYKL